MTATNSASKLPWSDRFTSFIFEKLFSKYPSLNNHRLSLFLKQKWCFLGEKKTEKEHQILVYIIHNSGDAIDPSRASCGLTLYTWTWTKWWLIHSWHYVALMPSKLLNRVLLPVSDHWERRDTMLRNSGWHHAHSSRWIGVIWCHQCLEFACAVALWVRYKG